MDDRGLRTDTGHPSKSTAEKGVLDTPSIIGVLANTKTEGKTHLSGLSGSVLGSAKKTVHLSTDEG